jgi:multidrug resistance efflux pump
MKDLFRGFLKKKSVRWVLALVVAAALLFAAFGGEKPVTYETAVVSRGAVLETVTGTGQIKPKAYASLHFKTAGTISRMHVDVGDSVGAGQTLAALDASDLVKKVTQAEADLVAANVSLANAEQEVSDQRIKGEQSLTVLYEGIPNSFNEILNLTQQVYSSFATFYDSSNHLTSSIANPVLDSQRVIDADKAFPLATIALTKIRGTIENFPSRAGQEAIDKALEALHQPLQDLQVSLGALINAIAAIPTGAVSAATLDGYKTTLSAARTNLNSAIAEESEAVSDVRDARIQNSLSLNAKEASLRTAKANVEKAKASLAIAQQSLSDAYLKAPIAGIVASKGKQVGEQVAVTDQVFYLMGRGGLEIVANIPEIDIAKISVGDPAEVLLDAYGTDTRFKAVVSSIDPAETIVDGVATYRVKFDFDQNEVQARSGMSAEVKITTDARSEVLAVPQRAVVQGKGKVRVLRGEVVEEREVSLGLRGSDGRTEVLSGLSEGDTIVISQQ